MSESTYLSSIEQKLKRLDEQKERRAASKYVWKPKQDNDGKPQTVRILPYKEWPDPFVELYIHYGIQPGGILSRNLTMYVDSDDDPIFDYCEQLKQDDWQTYRKIQPNMRPHIPLIERGNEFDRDGNPIVKFWGVSQTLYRELLEYAADPEYGEYWDSETGTDIMVTYTKGEGDDYGKTSIRFKRSRSKLFDDAKKSQLILESVPDWTAAVKIPTVEESQEALDKWIKKMTSQDDEKTEKEEATSNADASTTVDIDKLQDQLDSVLQEAKSGD